MFTLLAPGNYSGANTACLKVQTVNSTTCADIIQSTTQLLVSSISKIQTSVIQSTTVRSSDNTFIFTSYSTGQYNYSVYYTVLR